MSTISLKKGAPAEITIPEIQKRYRISPKTDLAFQRFGTLLTALKYLMIFPQLFHCPKLPSYIAASLAPSSRRSTVQSSPSNIAASLNPPSHQTTAQSYLPMFQHHWTYHLTIPPTETLLAVLHHPVIFLHALPKVKNPSHPWPCCTIFWFLGSSTDQVPVFHQILYRFLISGRTNVINYHTQVK